MARHFKQQDWASKNIRESAAFSAMHKSHTVSESKIDKCAMALGVKRVKASPFDRKTKLKELLCLK